MVLPDMAVTMSPGRCARLPGMFSTQGMKAVTASGGFNWAMARMAPIMAAPPDISYFIFSMPSEGLMEMPPVSKVTPLPTRPRCAAEAACLRPVADDDERGRLGAALRHAEQRAHAEAFEVAAFQYLALEPLLLRHLARGGSHFQRRQEVGGLVRQRAGEVLGLGQHLAARHRGVEPGRAVRAHHGKRVQRLFVVAGLVAIGFEVAEDGAFHGGRGEFGAGAVSFQQHGGRQHLLLFQEAHRRGHQLAQLGGIETFGLSAARQQHARGGGSGRVVQQREFARLAGHFAGFDKWRSAEARLLFSFEDRHNQRAGGNLFGGISFERDFHQLRLSPNRGAACKSCRARATMRHYGKRFLAG